MAALSVSPKICFAASAREVKARVSAGLHASTSAAACTWVRAPRRHRGAPSRGCSPSLARRGGGDRYDFNEEEDDRRPGKRPGKEAGGFQFSNRRGMYRFQYNEYETEVRQEEAWKLVVPLVGALVLAAAVIGPLVIGLAFTAVAVGAALSAGALFTSLFLPLFLAIGAGALFFGGLTFSAFATLGTALLLPKLIALAVAAGGLGLGALAVSLFLKPAADKSKASYSESGSGSGSRRDAGPGKGKGAAGAVIDVVPEPEPKMEVDPEIDRQLREFDELLAGREEQRRRTERWRARDGSR